MANLADKLKAFLGKDKVTIADSESTLVIQERVNGEFLPPYLEPLDGAVLSEERMLKVKAHINDVLIPEYFENGARTILLRTCCYRRQKYKGDEMISDEIMHNEPYTENET